MKKYPCSWLYATLLMVSSPLALASTNNLAPVVTWIRPTNGASFTAGSGILLTARATDSDGTVSFVEFFASSTNSSMLLGRAVSPTNLYNFVWSNAPAGTFELHAEAVDNAGGRGISGSVQILVRPGGGTNNAPPTIVSQPQSQTVTNGADVTFSVSATGTPPLSYRWRKGGAIIPGANSSTLTLSNVTSSDAGAYSVTVSNMFGSRLSSNAVLTVISSPGTNNTPPVVTWLQPTNGSTFPAGSTILLRARATDSDGTVSFVEFYANSNLLGTVSGASTNSVYTFVWSNAPAGNFRLHAEAVDNAGGRGISGSVQIVVTGGGGTNMVPVVTWIRPTNGATFPAGSSIQLTARATDSDGTVSFVEFLASTTNSTMNLGRVFSSSSNNLYNLTWSNAPAGSFRLHAEAVDNAGGRGISGSVQIAVGGGGGGTNAPPTIVSQPQSQTVSEGTDVTFSVSATGSPPLSYRWRKNSVPIPGATSSTLTLSNVTESDEGAYSVTVSNMFGTRVSSNAVLTVIPAGTNNAGGLQIAGRGTTGPGGWDLTVFAQRNSNGVTGHISVAGGATGPVVQLVPPGNDACGCWCINARRTDVGPGAGDHRENVYIRDVGDGITTFDQFALVSGIGIDCSFPTDGLQFLTLREGDFKSSQGSNPAPVARIQIENAVTFLGHPTVITLDASSGRVILDGSRSSDPDNDPLTYIWAVGEPPEAFATGVRVSPEVATGSYVFQLQVSNGELTGTDRASVDVLTPCDAIALLILQVAESSHPTRIKRPLIRALEMSCDRFERGQVDKGIELLEAFQHKVVVQLGQVDRAFAERLINAAQALIDAIPLE